MTKDIRDFLSYDPETGRFLWKHRVGGRSKLNEEAGAINQYGYRRIGFQGKQYLAHRLAFFFMKGFWPTKGIDHANLNRLDNRWVNLRQCNDSQNQANTAPRSKFGKGVTFHKGVGRYQAQIKVGGKSHYLGLFDDPLAAHAAYALAAVRLHGEFARVSA